MKDSRLTALKTVFLLSSERGRGEDSDKLWTCKTVTMQPWSGRANPGERG